MKRKFRPISRIMGIVLTLAMAMALMTGTAFAADDMGMGGDMGGGGSGGGSQEFGTFDEVESYAGILAEDGVLTYADDWDGTIELDEGGSITAESITGATISVTEGNGAAISMSSASDVFTISNSTISATSGTINDDLGYEAAAGVAVGVETGELWIVDSTITSDGSRSTPVYLFSNSDDEATSLVVVDSTLESSSDTIWIPAFKLMYSGARATILMTENNSWFYGAEVISQNWGAISQDSVDATTYVVNSIGVSTEGGYGTYLTYGMELYGSELYGGQYGAFMCGDSLLITDTGANVSDEAMSKVPDYEVEDTTSIIAAPFNAIVVHNSLSDNTMKAVGYFSNTILSTLEEDLPDSVTAMSYDDEFFLDPDTDDYGISSGSAYFYNMNLYGSLVLVRSMNADFTFDNTDTRTSNGVLVQSVITFDPPSASGYLSVGEEVDGITATFLNGDYEGDILHQDYQRSMTVEVGENATLTGAVVSGTYAAWNNLWSEESLNEALEADGKDSSIFASDTWAEDVYDNLTIEDDTEYADTDNIGASVTVEAGGTWVVDGESTLSSLTIEEGGSVEAAEGYELVVYVNCDTSNSLLTYEGGEEIDSLSAGTYTDVRIEVVASADASAPSEEETEEEIETEEETEAEEPSEDEEEVSSDWAGYISYLVSFAEENYDSMAATDSDETVDDMIAAIKEMTEADYSTSILYQVLTDLGGALTYDEYLSEAGTGQEETVPEDEEETASDFESYIAYLIEYLEENADDVLPPDGAVTVEEYIAGLEALTEDTYESDTYYQVLIDLNSALTYEEWLAENGGSSEEDTESGDEQAEDEEDGGGDAQGEDEEEEPDAGDVSGEDEEAGGEDAQGEDEEEEPDAGGLSGEDEEGGDGGAQDEDEDEDAEDAQAAESGESASSGTSASESSETSESDTSSADVGDSNMLLFWSIILCLAAAGIVLSAAVRKRV